MLLESQGFTMTGLRHHKAAHLEDWIFKGAVICYRDLLPVALVREPQNSADPGAISVELRKASCPDAPELAGSRIGYIPKTQTWQLQGLPFGPDQIGFILIDEIARGIEGKPWAGHLLSATPLPVGGPIEAGFLGVDDWPALIGDIQGLEIEAQPFSGTGVTRPRSRKRQVHAWF